MLEVDKPGTWEVEMTFTKLVLCELAPLNDDDEMEYDEGQNHISFQLKKGMRHWIKLEGYEMHWPDVIINAEKYKKGSNYWNIQQKAAMAADARPKRCAQWMISGKKK